MEYGEDLVSEDFKETYGDEIANELEEYLGVRQL